MDWKHAATPTIIIALWLGWLVFNVRKGLARMRQHGDDNLTIGLTFGSLLVTVAAFILILWAWNSWPASQTMQQSPESRQP